MSLPRDILKWMQSLDLSYSVKNVRRDFSNGFLVAEIISRFLKSQIQMHSFDNGTSMKKREDNWSLLELVFQKKNWNISRELINDVIHCQPDAAAKLIEQIYTILTKRAVQQPVPLDDEEYTPPFARSTAALKVKDKLREPAMLASDDVNQMRAAAEVIQGHNEALRTERTMEPERFLPPSRSAQSLRVSQRAVGMTSEAEAPQVQFKQVQVKQIDDSKASQMRQARSTQGLNSSQSLDGGVSTAQSSRLGVRTAPSKPALELLSSCVVSRLEGSDAQSDIDPRRGDAMDQLVESIATLDADFVALVFEDIRNMISPELADCCLASPKEFWQVFGLLWASLSSLGPSSPAHGGVLKLIETLGQEMSSRDPVAALGLLHDYGLPKMYDALKVSPQLSRVVYAFAAPRSFERIKAIRKLRDGLDDVPALTRCLAHLIELETDLSTQLLDLYLNYIVEGLRNSDASVRATCVGMLASLARAQDGEFVSSVSNLLESLGGMADDAADVQAQLLGCYCALLSQLPAENELCEELYARVQNLMSASAAPEVQEAGLVALSQCVGSRHPSMSSLFTEYAFDKPDVSARALDTDRTGGVAGLNGATIGDMMNSEAVAAAVVEHVQTNGLGNLTLAHVKLLAAAVGGALAEDAVEEWRAVYDALREHLIVELCDAKHCRDVLGVLAAFLAAPGVVTSPAELFVADENTLVAHLFGALSLLFPEGDKGCQEAVADFLYHLASQQHTPFPDLVRRLVQDFAASAPDVVQGSILKSLL